MSAESFLSRLSRTDLAAAVKCKLLSMPRADVLVAMLAADEDLTEIEAADAIDCSVKDFHRRYAAILTEIRSALRATPSRPA